MTGAIVGVCWAVPASPLVSQGCVAQGTAAVVLNRDEKLPVRERAIKKADKLLPSLVENITNIIILLFDGAIAMYL